MISALVPLLLEASLRALLAAVAVWAGLRVLGVGNVVVEKVAWGLVLLAASSPAIAMNSVPVSKPGSPTGSQLRASPVAFGWALYLGVFAALLLRLAFGLAAALRLWMTARKVPAHLKHYGRNDSHSRTTAAS